MLKKRKAAFIDRDGVINEERNYVHRIEDFVILPNVINALSILSKLDFLLIIVTNQAGIAKGFYDEIMLDNLHTHMLNIFEKNNILIDAIYYCPHHPHGSIPE